MGAKKQSKKKRVSASHITLPIAEFRTTDRAAFVFAESLQSSLEKTSEALKNCTDPDARKTLTQEYDATAARLAELSKMLSEINRQRLERTIPPKLKIGNPAVFLRDATIYKYRNILEHLIICRKLDAELIQRGVAPLGLPGDWETDYKVVNYVGAYEHPKCRPLVQKMISTAKKRFQSLT